MSQNLLPEYLAALERERTDTSWKTYRPDYEEPRRMTTKERKLWFDAGRFAQGARDSDAIKGNRAVIRLSGQ